MASPLLFATLPDINPVLQSYLDFLVSQRQAQWELIKQYRRYTNGEQAATLNDSQIALLNADPDFVLNVCPSVLGAKCDRLVITGFTVTSPDEQDQPKEEMSLSPELEEQVQNWWDMSRMDSESSNLHYAASRDGDAFLIVDYCEDEYPRLTLNMAYDGESGVEIAYDEGDYTRPLYATKRWTVSTPADMTKNRVRRLNVYYDNRVEKYISDGSGSFSEAGWRPYEGDGDSVEQVTIENYDGTIITYNAAVAWWTDTQTAEGEPLGLPVVHFANASNGMAYGRSDIADVIPGLQDAVNLTGVSLLAAAQLAGFPVNYIIGNFDGAGQFATYPGAILTVPDKDGNAGQFPAANLNQLADVITAYIRHIATITHTPMSYFNITGQVSAEGTLQAAEAPLLAKAKRAQASFGNKYEDAIRLMLKLEMVYGSDVSLTLEQIDELTIACKWEAPQTRNEKETAETVLLHIQAGIPEEMAWTKLGYSAPEINEMKRMKRKAQMQQNIDGLRQQQSNATDQLLQSQDEMGKLNERQPNSRVNSIQPGGNNARNSSKQSNAINE